MRAIDVLEIRLEADIVSSKGADGVIDVLFGECGVDHRRRSHSLGESTGSNGLNRIVTTDVMWDGISHHDVLETASGNLVVVIRVTPGPETLLGGVGKDRRVIQVRRIYFRVRPGTECPS